MFHARCISYKCKYKRKSTVAPFLAESQPIWLNEKLQDARPASPRASIDFGAQVKSDEEVQEPIPEERTQCLRDRTRALPAENQEDAAI